MGKLGVVRLRRTGKQLRAARRARRLGAGIPLPRTEGVEDEPSAATCVAQAADRWLEWPSDTAAFARFVDAVTRWRQGSSGGEDGRSIPPVPTPRRAPWPRDPDGAGRSD